MLGKPGGIFVLRVDQIPPDRILLQAVARVVLMAESGSLEEQLDQIPAKPQMPPALRPSRAAVRDARVPSPARDLIHFNGLGGFTRDGREYVITLAQGQTRPPLGSISSRTRISGPSYRRRRLLLVVGELP
jgi:cyclic beta-1,2-glucan synthetase